MRRISASSPLTAPNTINPPRRSIDVISPARLMTPSARNPLATLSSPRVLRSFGFMRLYPSRVQRCGCRFALRRSNAPTPKGASTRISTKAQVRGLAVLTMGSVFGWTCSGSPRTFSNSPISHLLPGYPSCTTATRPDASNTKFNGITSTPKRAATPPFGSRRIGNPMPFSSENLFASPVSESRLTATNSTSSLTEGYICCNCSSSGPQLGHQVDQNVRRIGLPPAKPGTATSFPCMSGSVNAGMVDPGWGGPSPCAKADPVEILTATQHKAKQPNARIG